MNFKKTITAMMLLAGVVATAEEKKTEDIVKEVIQELKKDKSFEWASRIKFYADLRARLEHESGERNTIVNSDGESVTTPNNERDRLRIRARLNMDATLDSEWMGSIQLSTGTADPTSGNQSMGQGFEGKSFGLERAYIRYTPEELGKQVKFTVGKMGQPWISVSDLIYDSSLNPEGVAAVGEFKLDGITLYANGGFFQAKDTLNDNGATSPSRLYSAQVAAKVFMDEYTMLVGASAYIWDSLKGKNPRTEFWGQGSGAGINNGGAHYDVNRYDEVELFAAFDADLAIPCGIYGQFVNNAKGDKDKNAYLVGVKAGKADKGKLEASYDYRFTGRDSVLSSYSEGSVWGGGTDGKGHRVQLKYGLTKAVQLGLTGFFTKANVSGTQTNASAYSGDYRRFQFDIVAKF